MTRSVGVGFVSCDGDCYGASLTDLIVALHALHTAVRIVRRVRREHPQASFPAAALGEPKAWSFGTIALGTILSYCARRGCSNSALRRSPLRSISL